MNKAALIVSIFVLTGLFFALSPEETSAQSKTRVRFARGATSATVNGVVKGYAYRDYLFGARGGQRVSVDLDSKYPHPQMFVRDSNGENLSTGAGEWNGEIPATGTYTVRVLLPRAFARRAQSSSYKLTIRIE
jgi:hypothetical protein